jgi:hypothetical protein
MALGDLVVADDQIEFAGLLIDVNVTGSTQFWLDTSADVEGFGLADWTANPTETPFGAVMGVRRRLPKTLTLGLVYCESDANAMELRAAWRPSLPQPLVWRGHGWGSTKYLAYVEPLSLVERSTSTMSKAGMVAVVPEFWAGDSRVYALAAHETTVTGSNPVVPNAGDEPSPWILVVEGACTGPRVRNMDTNQAWRFDDLVLSADQTLTVDTRAMTAIVSEDGEDDVDVWAMASDDGGDLPMLWGIEPGGTPVGFARTSGSTTATLTSWDTH